MAEVALLPWRICFYLSCLQHKVSISISVLRPFPAVCATREGRLDRTVLASKVAYRRSTREARMPIAIKCPVIPISYNRTARADARQVHTLFTRTPSAILSEPSPALTRSVIEVKTKLQFRMLLLSLVEEPKDLAPRIREIMTSLGELQAMGGVACHSVRNNHPKLSIRSIARCMPVASSNSL